MTRRELLGLVVVGAVTLFLYLVQFGPAVIDWANWSVVLAVTMMIADVREQEAQPAQ
jgi:hypothetical protein